MPDPDNATHQYSHMPCLSPYIAQLALQSTWHVLHLAELAKLAKQACYGSTWQPTAWCLWPLLNGLRTCGQCLAACGLRLVCDMLKTPVWALFQVWKNSPLLMSADLCKYEFRAFAAKTRFTHTRFTHTKQQICVSCCTFTTAIFALTA